MIVDTSALIEIALDGPGAERLLRILHAHPAPRISAGTLLETYIVIDGRWGQQAPDVVAHVIQPIGLMVEPVTETHVALAREAYRQYGKGSGHGARLNYGDCFAYALTRERNEPLLFVGEDFTQTDIEPAWTGNQ